MSALIQTSFTPNALILPSLPFPSYYYCLTKQAALIRIPLTSTFHCQIYRQKLALSVDCHFRILSAQQTTTATAEEAAAETTSASPKRSVAVYLTERLGFTDEQSLTISKKLLRLRDYPHAKKVTDLISFQNADNVITFLHQHCGFDHSQVKKLVSKYPKVLGANVDKTIKPKVKLVQDLGFTSSDLAHVLSTNPRLYLLRDLGPAIQVLRGILGSDDKAVVKVFKRLNCSSATHMNYIKPNVDMLENEYGIPRDKLIKSLTKSPQSFWRKTEWLRVILVRIEDKWGISRESGSFLMAVHVFCCLGDDSINSKCQVYRSYGWSESDIRTLINRNPNCISYSEARIKKLLDFYMNELGYEPAYMATRSVLFSCSLENRIMPRHRVLSILKEKGLINADTQLCNVLLLTEERFFNKLILPFENAVPKLLEVYGKG